MKRVKGFALSLGVTAAAGAVILAVAALAVWKMGSLPQGPVLSVVVTAAACAAVFLGGISAALFTGEKGILLGGACGLFAACCVAAVSLALSGGTLTLSGGARLLAIFISGCIGGVLGVNRRHRVKF